MKVNYIILLVALIFLNACSESDSLLSPEKDFLQSSLEKSDTFEDSRLLDGFEDHSHDNPFYKKKFIVDGSKGAILYFAEDFINTIKETGILPMLGFVCFSCLYFVSFLTFIIAILSFLDSSLSLMFVSWNCSLHSEPCTNHSASSSFLDFQIWGVDSTF